VNRSIAPLAATAATPVAMLHGACFPDDPWDAAAIAQVLGMAGSFGFVAWDGNAPCGFVLARDLGGEIEILALGTLCRRRRQGIGRALMEAAIAEAGRRGGSSIVLEAAADNEAARRLYAGLGFAPVGHRPHYYRRRDGPPADALILRRRIAGEPPRG
jgi:ribosomal-protein-alanine N-acetyltransferase